MKIPYTIKIEKALLDRLKKLAGQKDTSVTSQLVEAIVLHLSKNKV